MSSLPPETPKRGALSVPLGGVLSVMNALGSLWIFGLLLLINFDVLGRNLFNKPIDGVVEMIELSLVGIVFLQLGDATRQGRLTRSDGFFNYLSNAYPAFGKVLGVMVNLLGAVFMFLIFYGSYPLLVEAIELGHYRGDVGVFTAKVWPFKLIILMGCVVTGLQFLELARRSIGFPMDQTMGGDSSSGAEAREIS